MGKDVRNRYQVFRYKVGSERDFVGYERTDPQSAYGKILLWIPPISPMAPGPLSTLRGQVLHFNGASQSGRSVQSVIKVNRGGMGHTAHSTLNGVVLSRLMISSSSPANWPPAPGSSCTAPTRCRPRRQLKQ